MNKKLLSILIITPLLILAFVNTSFSRKTFAPPAKTGAPGENSCGSGTTGCHFKTATGTGGNLGCGADVGVLASENMDLKLTANGTEVNSSFEYTPNTDYTMVFTILNPTANGGFSLTAMNSSDAHVGTLSVESGAEAEISDTDANYVGHTNVVGMSEWTFNWKAPAENTGKVTFYASANKANGAVGMAPINSCGDTIVPYKMEINEVSSSTEINRVSLKNELSILNNPILNNNIVIETIVKEPKTYFIAVYSLTGQKVYSQESTFHTGIKNIEIPLNQKGIYILNITTNKNEFASYKILN